MKKKYMVLGVAFDWGGKRKGLDIFIELARELDERYQIVLVGTDDAIDRILPSNIVSIHRINNQSELAMIYTAADVFVNPTREDNFPTVNLEALACGTPVITFDTGGSPETIEENYGYVVPQEDFSSLKGKIEYICEKTPFSKETCLEKAATYDKNKCFRRILGLYDATGK